MTKGGERGGRRTGWKKTSHDQTTGMKGGPVQTLRERKKQERAPRVPRKTGRVKALLKNVGEKRGGREGGGSGADSEAGKGGRRGSVNTPTAKRKQAKGEEGSSTLLSLTKGR